MKRTDALVPVKCQGLTKRYGHIMALDNLDLEVGPNVVFGFLGPNGAGKTTTLKMLTGLSRPTSGRAWVAGEEVSPGSQTLGGKIGYLPEEPAFYNWMTGKEYLVFVANLFGLPSPETRKRCDELLNLVDLARDASRRIGGYSRGMRQRLGIAQALVNRPSVLFLDEPCSALDPFGRAEVLGTLHRLKDQATTVFMSSHILADVERICDVVAVINKGRLVVESGVEELRQRFAPSIFEMEFEQPAASFGKMVEAMPWVYRVDLNQAATKLKVHATDLARAKAELPGIVARSGLTLRRYEMVLPTLEDVFMRLLEDRTE